MTSQLVIAGYGRCVTASGLPNRLRGIGHSEPAQLPSTTMTVDLWDLRYRMYRHVADSGAVPGLAAIHSWVGDEDRADQLLAEMHDRHLVVLNEVGAVQMMLPFASTDTGHRVRSADTSWWANCAWDSLAIPIALGLDVEIDATWIDTGLPVDLAVRKSQLSSTEGFIEWRTPARHWWDDIVET